jgi:hypothetical protein
MRINYILIVIEGDILYLYRLCYRGNVYKTMDYHGYGIDGEKEETLNWDMYETTQV